MLPFTLPCPCCGDVKADISLNFGTGEFTCTACNADFDLPSIKNFIVQWSNVLRWIDSCPSTTDNVHVTTSDKRELELEYKE